MKLRNLIEESTFNNNAQILEDQNSELAQLRLDMLQQEEKQQEIQSKCNDYEEKIQKLEDLKSRNSQQIENQNYELTLLMEKLRKADLDKESTIERVKAEISGQPQDDTELKQIEEKCKTLTQSGKGTFINCVVSEERGG